MKAELLVGPEAHHAEGPVWDARDDSLYWVDMLAGDVLQFRVGGLRRHHVGTVAAALRPREAAGMVVAVERGFVLADAGWERIDALPDVFDDPAVRMNDGGCDPAGRFYCGTMAYDAATGAGTLFSLEPDYTVRAVLDHVTVSNGLDWSPDGETVYYNDTATQRVDAFDFDAASGQFNNRRPIVTIDPELGGPDGLTVDAEGGIWVALWDGGAVHRYSPTGTLDAVIELPTTRVTACTFGGSGLDTLFITTSALGLDGTQPLAGSVFSAKPGTSGQPVRTFAG